MTARLHRYQLTTHAGGTTSIGATSELAAALNLVGALATAATQRDEELRSRGFRGIPATDLIANLPVAVAHMARCGCGERTSAAELYAGTEVER